MRRIFIGLLVASSLLGFSQDKLLTIQDAIRGFQLYPKGLYDVQWLPGGKWFSQLTISEALQTIEVQEISVTKGRNIRVSLDDINASLSEDAQLKRLPRANWINDKEFQFISNSQGYAYHIEKKSIRILPFKNKFNVDVPYWKKSLMSVVD